MKTKHSQPTGTAPVAARPGHPNSECDAELRVCMCVRVCARPFARARERIGAYVCVCVCVCTEYCDHGPGTRWRPTGGGGGRLVKTRRLPKEESSVGKRSPPPKRSPHANRGISRGAAEDLRRRGLCRRGGAGWRGRRPRRAGSCSAGR